MIEFKADCGHTIRARAEDAGKVVSCAYCGKRVTVPAPEDPAFEQLLTEAFPEPAAPGGGGLPAWLGGRGQFNPVRIARTALVLVVALSVLIIVVKRVGREILGPTKSPAPAPTAEGPGPQSGAGVSPAAPTGTRDLYDSLNPAKTGVFAHCVPSPALVYVSPYYRSESDQQVVADPDEALTRREYLRGESVPLQIELPPGTYWVSFVVEPTNPAYREHLDVETYRRMRRVIQPERREQAERFVAEFFVRDEAERCTVTDVFGGGLRIVKHYRVHVPVAGWTPVIALFTPEGLEPVEFLTWLGDTNGFRVDRDVAYMEMSIFDVPELARDFGYRALRKIGKAILPRVDSTGQLIHSERNIFLVMPDERRSILRLAVHLDQLARTSPPEDGS